MLETKVIAFAGGIASGKDTYGQAVANHIKNSKQYSFATPLKEELNQIFQAFRNGDSIENISKEYNVDKENVQHLYEICKHKIKDNNINSSTRIPEMRKALQYWGTDVRRKQDKNYWVNKTVVAIQELLNNGTSLVYLTDGRFVNELSAIDKLGGITVRLDVSLEERLRRVKERDGIVPTKEQLEHPSETDYKNWDKFTHIINTEVCNPDIVIKAILG